MFLTAHTVSVDYIIIFAADSSCGPPDFGNVSIVFLVMFRWPADLQFVGLPNFNSILFIRLLCAAVLSLILNSETIVSRSFKRCNTVTKMRKHSEKKKICENGIQSIRCAHFEEVHL